MKRERDAAEAKLDDYVRGHMPEEPAGAYEDELFARALADSAPELAFRGELERTFRSMQARGTLDVWLTAREAERMAATGLRVVRFDLDPAQFVAPDLTSDFDILITRMPIDLSGVTRLDAEVLTPDGQLLKRMRDIAFEPSDHAIYACCEAALARVAASRPTITRVWATDAHGRRLVIELTP